MFWTSWFLAVLAIALAWPAPVLLSRAQWPARSPFTAMLLWQAIALAGGLSMIGAMLVYGLEPIGTTAGRPEVPLRDGLQQCAHHGTGFLAHLCALGRGAADSPPGFTPRR